MTSTQPTSYKETRYILSENQRNLLSRIRTWMMNYPLKIDGRKESLRFITTILDKDGYDEWDRNRLLSIRSMYITYIEQHPIT